MCGGCWDLIIKPNTWGMNRVLYDWGEWAMWYPGRGCSSWALLLSLGGGGRVAVCRFFCAPRMCGVGEPWNKLSYLLVLCLRGLDAVCNTFVCSTQNKQWVVGILSVFVDTEVLELCFLTDTDVCSPLWITIDRVLLLLCIVALGPVRHFVRVGWSSWCGCCLVATVCWLKITGIRRHNKHYLKYIGYMFRPVNR